MQVDVSFEFAKVYNIDKFDVVTGQKFLLTTDGDGTQRWFADNDAVLNIIQKNNTAAVEATAIGLSTILIMDNSFDVIKTLAINVVDAIVEPAIDLGTVADSPVKK